MLKPGWKSGFDWFVLSMTGFTLYGYKLISTLLVRWFLTDSCQSGFEKKNSFVMCETKHATLKIILMYNVYN